jgi:hypothetical protein
MQNILAMSGTERRMERPFATIPLHSPGSRPAGLCSQCTQKRAEFSLLMEHHSQALYLVHSFAFMYRETDGEANHGHQKDGGVTVYPIEHTGVPIVPRLPHHRKQKAFRVSRFAPGQVAGVARHDRIPEDVYLPGVWVRSQYAIQHEWSRGGEYQQVLGDRPPRFVLHRGPNDIQPKFRPGVTNENRVGNMPPALIGWH